VGNLNNQKGEFMELSNQNYLGNDEAIDKKDELYQKLVSDFEQVIFQHMAEVEAWMESRINAAYAEAIANVLDSFEDL